MGEGNEGDLLLKESGRLSMVNNKGTQGIFKFAKGGVNVVLVMQYSARQQNFFFTAYEVGAPSGTMFRISAKAPNGSTVLHSVMPLLSYRSMKNNHIARNNCFVISKEMLESMLDDEGGFTFSFQFLSYQFVSGMELEF